jgi:hypothetical protein
MRHAEAQETAARMIDNMRMGDRPERLHWELFPQFAEAECWAGGPDPQIALIGSIGAGLPPNEMVWLIGCYCAQHCVPSALAVWRRWPRPESILKAHFIEVAGWLEANWPALPVRPEMRHHRMPEKRAKALLGFAAYAQSWPRTPRYADAADPYEAAWTDTIRSIPYYGRYMAIKFLEFLSRSVAPELRLSDLRPEGGWSPRRVLSWMFPRQAEILNSTDTKPRARAAVHGVASEMLKHIRATRVPNLSWFDLQVLLCEYREHWDGGFYAGCTHDEEVLYAERALPAMGDGVASIFYDHRSRLFPDRVLGERRGWHGIRKPCALTLKKQGFIWSDRTHDYPSMELIWKNEQGERA